MNIIFTGVQGTLNRSGNNVRFQILEFLVLMAVDLQSRTLHGFQSLLAVVNSHGYIIRTNRDHADGFIIGSTGTLYGDYGIVISSSTVSGYIDL